MHIYIYKYVNTSIYICVWESQFGAPSSPPHRPLHEISDPWHLQSVAPGTELVGGISNLGFDRDIRNSIGKTW